MERGDKVEHRWQMRMHVDACHFFASTYVCLDCGAVDYIEIERSIMGDPWSRVWMEESNKCGRCEELAAGAPTLPPKEIYEPA